MYTQSDNNNNNNNNLMMKKLRDFKNFVDVEIRNNYHLSKKKEGLMV